MKLVRFIFVLFMSTISLLTGCDGSNGGFDSEDNSLVEIVISPIMEQGSSNSLDYPKGTTGKFSALGIFSDGTKRDISHEVIWSVSQTNLGSFTENVFLASDEGSGDVSASLHDIISNKLPISVTSSVLTKIQISTEKKVLPLGLSLQYTAIGTYTDNSTKNISDQVKWSSRNSLIAELDNFGLLSSKKIGETSISAKLDNISSNLVPLTVTDAVLVKLQITPAALTIAKGLTYQYEAIATYTDHSTLNVTKQVKWYNNNKSKVEINENGVAKALDIGDAKIYAEFNHIKSNSASFSVTEEKLAKIQVTPAALTIAKGLVYQYEAIGTYTDGKTVNITKDVIWNSSDNDVVNISNGLALMLGIGHSNITAILNGVKSNKASIEVTEKQLIDIQITPVSLELALGISHNYIAKGIYSDQSVEDITKNVAWDSSNTEIATIKDGKVLTNSLGKTEVTAYLNSVKSNVSQLTIIPEKLVKLQIPSAALTLPKGLTYQHQALGSFTNGKVVDVTDLVNWNSSNTENVTINKGLLAAVSPGSSFVQAYLNGVQSNNVSIVVTEPKLKSIQITPAKLELNKGLKSDYIAMGTYTDGEVKNITEKVSWNSSNTDIATIVDGKVTGIDIGSTYIDATLDGIISNKSELSVIEAKLLNIEISVNRNSIPKGTSAEFKALGIYSDGTNVPITEQVSWVSSNINIVTIDDKGHAVGQDIGYSLIHANMDGVTSKNEELIVTKAIVKSLIISSDFNKIAKGLTVNYTAKATFTDEEVINVTESANWDSSNIDIAVINREGIVNTNSVGNTEISANYDGVESNKLALEVTNAEITRIEVTPKELELTVYFPEKLKAYAIFTDGNREDITNKANWHSDNPNIQVVNGQVESSLVGERALIKATLNNINLNEAKATVVEANLSQLIGENSTYKTIISSSAISEVFFKTGGVLDGIYTTDGQRLAGGPGGPDSSDILIFSNVSHIKGFSDLNEGVQVIYGLKWEEDGIYKSAGKTFSGEETSFSVKEEILGMIVYSTGDTGMAGSYIKGIQFIYR
ncbi:Ig-like domain-containing protein [Photobacterium damselae]|uniref:Ig-like domain-containing protein n=1 Tax=Photobacterium damselae TaxID=38293 RepID=UPI000DFBA3A5|nr:Ig-like domain-containing protein [Photobacterium damselae]SUB90815.1 Bacterial Ig-like domain (group 2) [Photobacterium damselae]